METQNETKAKEICDCDNCKACSKFAEEGAAYAFISTCNRFDELMQAMRWKDDEHAKEKQQWIEKTCEWIKDNAAYFAHWEWNGDTYEKEVVFDAECCVEAFEESIKAMEEEI